MSVNAKPLKKELTWDLILEEVSEEQIFSYYIGRFVIGGVQCSPLRKDNNPSFSIRRNRRGGLSFIDYADENFRGNGATFVMKRYGLSYNDALEKIDLDLNLGIRFPKKTNYTLPKAPKPLELPTKKEITIIPKKYTEKELKYWLDFGINLERLKEENIYSLGRYFVNGEERFVREGELAFAYHYPEIGKKLYFPEREQRWRSSIPNTLIEWGKITDFSCLRITKSKKDRLVLSSILKNCANVQNESSIFATEENLAIINRFKSVVVIYDNDDAGYKAGEKIKEQFGWKTLYFPKEEGVTDAADYYKKHGREDLIKYLRQNIK